MKKTVKILLIVLLAMVVVISLSTSIYAADKVGILGDVENATKESNVETGELSTKAGDVLSILQTVGIIAGVIILAILGIKFMMGSAEEKAEYKKSFIPLIVGAVVLMSAFSIAKFLFNAVG